MISSTSGYQSAGADPLVQGLARNPAAPLDVLLGLLRVAPLAACQGLKDRRNLPPPVQDVMVHHPLRVVRGTLAEHPGVDSEIRSRLLTDLDWWVTLRAIGRPGQQPLSDDMLRALLTRIEDAQVDGTALLTVPEFYGELWESMLYHPRRLYRLGAAHADPRVRRHAAAVPHSLDESSREALLADPVPEIQEVIDAALGEDQRVMQPADLPDHHCHGFWAVLQRPLSRALIDQVVASGDDAALHFVASNRSTPPDVVQALLRHPAADVRRQVAGRVDLNREQLLELAADPAVEVRTAVSVHPGLTEQDRARIDIDVTTFEGNGHYGLRHQCQLDEHIFADRCVPSLADALRWARSVNPLLRRRAACNSELPTNLVASLADDPDLGVRVLLARHHPDAPPAMLLRCFLEYQGYGREQLADLPQFPTAGLATLADHTDPVVRRLVTRDPYASPDLVERMCSDPDLAVRRAVAACPRLPIARMIDLLDNPDMAEYAAANPALPVSRMHQILKGVICT